MLHQACSSSILKHLAPVCLQQPESMHCSLPEAHTFRGFKGLMLLASCVACVADKLTGWRLKVMTDAIATATITAAPNAACSHLLPLRAESGKSG
jgi:hypothetical protein